MRTLRFRLFVLLLFTAPLWMPHAVVGAQQDGRITLESLYGAEPSQQVQYSGDPVRGIAWVDPEHYVRPPRGDEATWMRVEARTGVAEPAVDIESIRASLVSLPAMTEAEAASLARQAAGALARGEDATLLNHAHDLFLVRADGTARRLTFDAAEEVGEEISPDGAFVSFIRDYDIWLVDVDSGRERQLTADGGPELFYGRLDWVYQEEIYGRGNFKGYWWSPDSRHIAFLRLDESPVREFTIVDHIPHQLETEVTNYPKAGTPNPRVTLGVVPAMGGDVVWVDTREYEPIEHLIVDVSWHPAGDRLVYQVQDREQRWLDLLTASPDTGAATRLLHEESPAFVQVLGAPRWLDDGSFLWFSERSGYKHLYRYALPERGAAELVGQVTSGEWEARDLHGVDEQGRVYFSGTERSPIGVDVYRVDLDGSGLERLSGRPGTHSAQFDPQLALYVDTWSDVRTPPQVRLHDAADGSEVRVVDANPTPELDALDLGEVELLQVPTGDGFLMEAMLIRPPDFDPSRKYPVLQYNYGGPHAPVVRDSWGGTTYLWHQLLAQRGYVIWYCDNRSASGKGIAPTWQAYGQMGVVELRDIEDGVDWLRQQPWVDGERIGIWGWSYGGFMTAYALTHSTSFKAGIAGAPVTDWRLYDTIYTERYMRMPQNNPEGYDATSVVRAAGDLHGNLLILHGTMDDNVHMQNSVQLIYELQKAGKEFDLMVYPRARHGVREPELVWHLRRRMTDWLLENL